MTPDQPGRRVRFAALVAVLQLAALAATARLMIRPIRADGGTWTEYLFYDIYALVLVLGMASVTLGCGALLRRLLGPAAERAAAVGLGALFSLALAADVLSFSVLGVHPFSRAVWSAVSAADVSRHLPRWSWLAAAGVVTAAVLLAAVLWRLTARLGTGPRWARLEARLTWRIPLYFAVGLATFVALDRPDEERVVPRAGLPLYGLWLAAASHFPDARPAYPLGSEPPPATFARRPDLVLLLVESLRWDIMTPEVMPFLSRLAASPGCASPRDYAGGHLTQYGSFPLLYGLAGYAFQPFMKEGRPSDPLTALRRAGYRLEGYDASGLLYYSTPPVLGSQFDRYESPLEQDSTVIRDMVATLRGPAAAPRFVFGFLYSTHGGYNYPPSFARYPTEGLALGAREALWNRYRNAAGYVDALVAQLDSVLAPRLADGTAALVVTGDHGEAFDEHGVMGHAADLFYDEETRVPLVMCFRGARAMEATLSSHADVLPTLFDWMGAAGWDSTRLTGRSLLGPPRNRVVSIAGVGFPIEASDFALVTPAHKYWLHLTGPELAAVALDRATDAHDRPVPLTPAVRQDYAQALAAYLRAQRAVLRVN